MTLTLVATGAAAAPAQAAAPSWTHDGYGPGNTSYNPAESVVNATSIKRLRLKWRAVPAAGTDGCQSQTAPVVVGGRMFMIDGDGVGAYDALTGRRLWRDATVMDSMVHRTLTVAGGLVITTGYSCYGVSDPSGHIAALDAATGKRRWRVIEGSATEHVVADSGMLISYSKCEVCSSNLVAAYRLSDGAPVWSHPDTALTSPVSANGRLLLTGENGTVAVAAGTGRVLWRSAAVLSVLAANPAGDQFYVSNRTGTLAALQASTGRVVWSAASAAGQLAADGRRVYVIRDGITAYDAVTGRRLWRRAVTSHSKPVRAGGLLYTEGSVLSPTTGALIMPATYSSAFHHAVVVNGRILRVKGFEVQAYAP